MRQVFIRLVVMAGLSGVVGGFAMAAPMEVRDGLTGEVLGAHVGVAGIAQDGTRATIVVTGVAGGGPWEARFDVATGQVVPVGGRLASVVSVTVGSGSARGSVGFAAVDGAAVGADVVMVPVGGRLRLDGPSVMTAIDLVVELVRDGTVALAWHPARAPDDPREVTRSSLTVGQAVGVGDRVVTVVDLSAAGRVTMRLGRK